MHICAHLRVTSLAQLFFVMRVSECCGSRNVLDWFAIVLFAKYGCGSRNRYHPGKWKHGLKPVVPRWFNSDPYPFVCDCLVCEITNTCSRSSKNCKQPWHMQEIEPYASRRGESPLDRLRVFDIHHVDVAQKHGDQNHTKGQMEPKTKSCVSPSHFSFEPHQCHRKMVLCCNADACQELSYWCIPESVEARSVFDRMP